MYLLINFIGMEWNGGRGGNKSMSFRFRFSHFHIFEFPISDFVLGENISEKYVGEISKKKNKGVLERAWTKWKVFRAISSTLKFPKSWKLKIPLFHETENWRPGVYFDAKYVSAHPRHAKTAPIAR